MKKLIFTSVAFLLMVAGCRKDQELKNNTTQYENALPGADAEAGEEAIQLTQDQSLKCFHTHHFCGTTTMVNLLNMQQAQIGTISVANDEHNLYVTYNTQFTPWKLYKIRLFVGDCNGVPLNQQGYPLVNQFPKKLTFCGYYLPQKYTVTIPLHSLPQCFCVAAQAVAAKRIGCNWITETLWGEGTPFGQQACNGMHFDYCQQNCGNTPPPGEGCGYRAPYWFNGYNNWPNGQISVAGYTYTQAEGFALGAYYNDNYSPALYVFFQSAAVHLSGNSIGASASVWADVAVIDAWLASQGKISVSNLPTVPQTVLDATAAVNAWLDINDCES